MKSKIILASAASMMAIAVTPVSSVFASYGVQEERPVTVGDVDTTIYDADIHWGNMVFDWKYDKNTNQYGFKAKVKCGVNTDGLEAWALLKEHGNLFSDDTCTSAVDGELSAQGPYYHKFIDSGHIQVIDKTTNGAITASAEFSRGENYEWVVGKIGSIEMGEAYGSPIVPLGYDVASDAITYDDSEDGALNNFEGYLHLEVSDMAAARSTAISSNDTIGTLTVRISQKI